MTSINKNLDPPSQLTNYYDIDSLNENKLEMLKCLNIILDLIFTDNSLKTFSEMDGLRIKNVFSNYCDPEMKKSWYLFIEKFIFNAEKYDYTPRDLDKMATAGISRGIRYLLYILLSNSKIIFNTTNEPKKKTSSKDSKFPEGSHSKQSKTMRYQGSSDPSLSSSTSKQKQTGGNNTFDRLKNNILEKESTVDSGLDDETIRNNNYIMNMEEEDFNRILKMILIYIRIIMAFRFIDIRDIITGLKIFSKAVGEVNEQFSIPFTYKTGMSDNKFYCNLCKDKKHSVFLDIIDKTGKSNIEYLLIRIPFYSTSSYGEKTFDMRLYIEEIRLFRNQIYMNSTNLNNNIPFCTLTCGDGNDIIDLFKNSFSVSFHNGLTPLPSSSFSSSSFSSSLTTLTPILPLNQPSLLGEEEYHGDTISIKENGDDFFGVEFTKKKYFSQTNRVIARRYETIDDIRNAISSYENVKKVIEEIKNQQFNFHLNYIEYHDSTMVTKILEFPHFKFKESQLYRPNNIYNLTSKNHGSSIRIENESDIIEIYFGPEQICYGFFSSIQQKQLYNMFENMKQDKPQKGFIYFQENPNIISIKGTFIQKLFPNFMVKIEIIDNEVYDVKYEDGTIYTGTLNKNYEKRKGKLQFPEGDKKLSFEGGWKNNYPEKGEVIYRDGTIYNGTLNKDYEKRNGKLQFPEGDEKSSFEGEWKNNGETIEGKLKYEYITIYPHITTDPALFPSTYSSFNVSSIFPPPGKIMKDSIFSPPTPPEKMMEDITYFGKFNSDYSFIKIDKVIVYGENGFTFYPYGNEDYQVKFKNQKNIYIKQNKVFDSNMKENDIKEFFENPCFKDILQKLNKTSEININNQFREKYVKKNIMKKGSNIYSNQLENEKQRIKELIDNDVTFNNHQNKQRIVDQIYNNAKMKSQIKKEKEKTDREEMITDFCSSHLLFKPPITKQQWDKPSLRFKNFDAQTDIQNLKDNGCTFKEFQDIYNSWIATREGDTNSTMESKYRLYLDNIQRHEYMVTVYERKLADDLLDYFSLEDNKIKEKNLFKNFYQSYTSRLQKFLDNFDSFYHINKENIDYLKCYPPLKKAVEYLKPFFEYKGQSVPYHKIENQENIVKGLRSLHMDVGSKKKNIKTRKYEGLNYESLDDIIDNTLELRKEYLLNNYKNIENSNNVERPYPIIGEIIEKLKNYQKHTYTPSLTSKQLGDYRDLKDYLNTQEDKYKEKLDPIIQNLIHLRKQFLEEKLNLGSLEKPIWGKSNELINMYDLDFHQNVSNETDTQITITSGDRPGEKEYYYDILLTEIIKFDILPSTEKGVSSNQLVKIILYLKDNSESILHIIAYLKNEIENYKTIRFYDFNNITFSTNEKEIKRGRPDVFEKRIGDISKDIGVYHITVKLTDQEMNISYAHLKDNGVTITMPQINLVETKKQEYNEIIESVNKKIQDLNKDFRYNLIETFQIYKSNPLDDFMILLLCLHLGGYISSSSTSSTSTSLTSRSSSSTPNIEVITQDRFRDWRCNNQGNPGFLFGVTFLNF